MANHVTFEERRILYRLKKKGKSNTEIAELMGRHRSTISRELSRNTGQRGYRPKQAQRLAEERRLASHRPHKMDDPDVHEYVQQKLEKRWSPDQIAGRAERDFPRAPSRWLSRQTIYDWINDRRPEWQTLLRRGGRPPEKRGKLSDVVRIDGRPEVINRRRRYGDWEGDTIVGKGRHSALVTLVERKSGYARIGRVDSMKSDITMRVAKRRMQDLPPCLRRSMTFDNGKEFAEHHKLTCGLGLEVYFADPYVSWQRGTNENTNGLLRQFFPKRTDFTQVSHRQVARVEQLLNERPRRRLDYRTPSGSTRQALLLQLNLEITSSKAPETRNYRIPEGCPDGGPYWRVVAIVYQPRGVTQPSTMFGNSLHVPVKRELPLPARANRIRRTVYRKLRLLGL